MSLILDSDGVYRCPVLKTQVWMDHGFGTAMQNPCGNDPTASLRQIHSSIVCPVTVPGDRQSDGDGLVTDIPSLWVTIRTADCLPILIADPVNQVVAAVHAGWRGTVSQIVRIAVECMDREYGSRPDDLIAAIGPGISRCCFEVGEEVAAHFSTTEIVPGKTNPKVDLKAANRRQLIEAGLNSFRISIAEECTMCTPGFHSYRRDRTEGRLVSGIRRRIGAV